MTAKQAQILYIPHGGGPMPVMGEEGHAGLVKFLKNFRDKQKKPGAIVVISAHWEERETVITSGANPELLFDYYGFPPETYHYKYPSPGSPPLAEKIRALLQTAGINASLDQNRGFDHGHFIPLMLMYPGADIPTIQISLIQGLDPRAHIALGAALSSLRENNILILGSGMSFHNMRAFAAPNREEVNRKNDAFHGWLNETVTSTALSESQRKSRLENWKKAPEAEYCHPREEHLIPLHVCYGIAGFQGERVFYQEVIGKRVSAFLWK